MLTSHYSKKCGNVCLPTSLKLFVFLFANLDQTRERDIINYLIRKSKFMRNSFSLLLLKCCCTGCSTTSYSMLCRSFSVSINVFIRFYEIIVHSLTVTLTSVPYSAVNLYTYNFSIILCFLL